MAKLNDVVGVDENGKPVTARERVLSWIGEGLPYDTSVIRAGLSTTTLHRLLNEAARAEEKAMVNPLYRMSRHERDMVLFSRQLEQAKAEAKAKYLELALMLARGGLFEETTVVTVDGQGNVMERKATRRRTLPSWNAVKWILEERFNMRLPNEVIVRDTMTGALSEDEGVDAIIEGMEAYLATRHGSSNGSGG